VKLLVVIPLILGLAGLRFLRPNLLVWALAWWVALFVAFRFGFSTPIPASVIAIYMGIATLALVAYVTSSRERLRASFDPLVRLVVERRYRPVLAGLIVLVPALLGLNAYLKTKVPIQPPFFARTIHPAPPASIEVHGNTIDLVRGHNPLRALEQSNPEQFQVHLANGRANYYKNCVYCHGDNLRATGMFAHGLDPIPTNFVESSPLPQLTESFIFWRIAKGGPGLPEEGGPWDSAMPAWEKFLSEQEMWEVVLFLYDFTGNRPRALEEGHE
jgi:mono/diheme cytochrome c family protein